MTVKQTVKITDKLNMYTRLAVKLSKLMQGPEAEVLLHNGEGTEAKVSSVTALLMLGSVKGRQIEVEATGSQEVEVLAAVIALLNSGFDEDQSSIQNVASRPDKAFTPYLTITTLVQLIFPHKRLTT